MSNLKLYDAEESNEMEGVEGEYFTYLDRNEFNNELNDVEIDDRFLRIPQQLITKRDKATELALIPYQPRAERQHSVSEQASNS